MALIQKTPLQWWSLEEIKMNDNRLIIVGAGGHGKVAADIAYLCGYKDIVFLDSNNSLIGKKI